MPEQSEQPWVGRRFVFVGGMHRSGTSTLTTVIGAADAASTLTGTGHSEDEGQFLQDVFPLGQALGGMTAWALDDRAYLDETDAALVPDAAARLWSGWSPFWDLTADHLVEKTPQNLTRTRFLQAVFPDSKFVVIVRHPVAQALAVSTKSHHRAERYGVGLPRMVEQWVRAHEAFRADQPHLRHVHVVRYEDLVADPGAVVDGLQAFLGFPLPREAVGAWDPARAHVYGERWNAGRHGGALATAVTAARAVPRGKAAVRRPARAVADRAMFRRYGADLQARFGDRIAALGYDLDDLEHARPWTTAGAVPDGDPGGAQPSKR